MISDGVSKTFFTLKKLNPYPVVKEECVNHADKRLVTALRKLKEGGKGKITGILIERQQILDQPEQI